MAGIKSQLTIRDNKRWPAKSQSEISFRSLARWHAFEAKTVRGPAFDKISCEVSCVFRVWVGASCCIYPVQHCDAAPHWWPSSRSHPKRFDVRRCPGRRFRHPRRIQRRQADGCGSVAAFGPSDYLDRRSKVLPTPRRRSLGNIAGRLAEFSGWQYAGGRKYHNTTACTPDVSYPGTDFPPKGPGSASCNLAGKPTQERRHPPAISEHGLFRSRRLRRGRRCQDISGRRPANSA